MQIYICFSNLESAGATEKSHSLTVLNIKYIFGIYSIYTYNEQDLHHNKTSNKDSQKDP
jgi:hypothetical protein